MSETTTAEPKPRLSPRRRAQRIRIVQYVVLVAVVVGIALAADWGQIRQAFFEPDFIKDTISGGLWEALRNTVVYTAGGFAFGLVLGTILALMRLSEVGPYRWIATTYIEFFRGLPALIVFLMLVNLPLGFPGLVMPIPPYGSVWLALGLVGAAYMAETIRGGIQAVPKGQVEAARTLGMSSGQATRKVVLPQAFRTMLPPLTNELILLVKDSSLVYALGLTAGQYELTKFGQDLANQNSNLTPLMMAGFAYLIITVPLGYVVRVLEAKTGGIR